MHVTLMYDEMKMNLYCQNKNFCNLDYGYVRSYD